MYMFMIAWNEYLYALLFLVQERSLWTAPLGIAQLTEFDTPVTILLAGSVVVTVPRSEEHTSELQSRGHLVCRLLLEKKKTTRRPEWRTRASAPRGRSNG